MSAINKYYGWLDYLRSTSYDIYHTKVKNRVHQRSSKIIRGINDGYAKRFIKIYTGTMVHSIY